MQTRQIGVIQNLYVEVVVQNKYEKRRRRYLRFHIVWIFLSETGGGAPGFSPPLHAKIKLELSLDRSACIVEAIELQLNFVR